jgi:hypothetical protein
MAGYKMKFQHDLTLTQKYAPENEQKFVYHNKSDCWDESDLSFVVPDDDEIMMATQKAEDVLLEDEDDLTSDDETESDRKRVAQASNSRKGSKLVVFSSSFTNLS